MLPGPILSPAHFPAILFPGASIEIGDGADAVFSCCAAVSANYFGKAVSLYFLNINYDPHDDEWEPHRLFLRQCHAQRSFRDADFLCEAVTIAILT